MSEDNRRNVVDVYRYWTVEAIVAELDEYRRPLHIVIENFENDSNIGTVVRTANVFLVEAVHIVGRKRRNCRGAMAIDCYQRLSYHGTMLEAISWARKRDLVVVAVDNMPGSVSIKTAKLSGRCLLLFGQGGPGVTEEAQRAADLTAPIA